MDSVDLDVLKRSASWVEESRPVLLVTVVKTWGSSPRPEGAMLAVRDDGLVVGSVSGGCIEDDLIDRTRRLGMTQKGCETVPMACPPTRRAASASLAAAPSSSSSNR